MEEPRRFILYSIAFASFQRYLNWINRRTSSDSLKCTWL